MAGESKRLATLQALTLYLATEISVVNGYKHDLADEVVGGITKRHVVRGRLKMDSDDPLPLVSILESPNPDRFPNRVGEEDYAYVDQKDNWTLLLQGWTTDDKINPTDPVYELMADVKKALAKLMRANPQDGIGMYENYRLGGLIVSLKCEPGTVRPPDEQSSEAFFWMRVILEFVENMIDPYDLS